MVAPNFVLSEPMVKPEAQDVTHHARRSGKAMVLSGLLIGLSCALLWNGMGAQQPADQDASMDMTVMPTRRFMQPNGHALAKRYGIGNTPMERFAIASIEAVNRRSRDVSMNAVEEDLGQKMTNYFESTIELKNASEAVILKAKEMVGVTPPLDFFDPIGFSTDISTGKLLFLREAELKHGRVCMLASLGILVGEQFHPMFGGNIDVPSYVAFQETPLQKFWFLVVTVIAIPEMFSVFSFVPPPGANPRDPESGAWWEIRSDREPGNFGFDPLSLRPTDAKEYEELRNKELNNGRLAMIAAAGMIAQELATGQKLFR